MPVSKAQQKAVAKYENANYDKFLVRMLPKGKKELLQAHAEAKGESLNGFVNRAIDETVQRDNGNISVNTESVKDISFRLTDEERAHIEKRRAVLAQVVEAKGDGSNA